MRCRRWRLPVAAWRCCLPGQSVVRFARGSSCGFCRAGRHGHARCTGRKGRVSAQKKDGCFQGARVPRFLRKAVRAQAIHSLTRRRPMPSPRALGSTYRSRSFAICSDSFTRKTDPTTMPSRSATHAFSAPGSKCLTKWARIPATSASWLASQPYSSQYTPPCRWMIQPMSPTRNGRRQ